MPVEQPSSRLLPETNLILRGLPDREPGLDGAAAYPPDWATRGEVDYLYRERNVLVRDTDVDIVLGGRQPILQGSPVQHEKNVRGLTRIQFAGNETQTVEQVCATADRRLGEGVLTPDHVLYVCPAGMCPATEPEEVRAGAGPDPEVSVSAEPCRGDGALIAVLDTGWLDGADVEHSWLAGVTGQDEPPTAGEPPHIRPYAGHGTFVAGVARTMAPEATVRVYRTFEVSGAKFESDLVADVTSVLRTAVDIISLDFGSNTRKDIPSLGFDVVGDMLRNHPGVALVAAAGNDSSRRPFWPAAFGWTVGVGALSANWRHRAWFSNYGPWVDVYAPGEDLVNAYAHGTYLCIDPPHAGEVRRFDGLARWSGTSFSTPLVSGLIAARMSATGEDAVSAAQALLTRARGQAIPKVGPVLFPGQACDDRCRPCGLSGYCLCFVMADSRAGSGSQPSWDQVILPAAETRANQGSSWTP
jgi:subtilisin family serine protease